MPYLLKVMGYGGSQERFDSKDKLFNLVQTLSRVNRTVNENRLWTQDLKMDQVNVVLHPWQ